MTEALVAKLFGVGVDSYHRLPLLLDLVAGKEGDVFWPTFLETWPSCDRGWTERRRLLSALRHHRYTDWRRFADSDANAFFDALPNTMTIYRGASSRRIRNGLSWTTEIRVAESFAKGHRGIRPPSPVVATARLSKAAVFAAFVDRGEAEVLIDPSWLPEKTKLEPHE